MNSDKFIINRSKLFRPVLPLDFIPRPQLIEVLESHHGIPLTLVSAPAGYGKSTTLSSWLETCGHKNAWLSLDESDNSFEGFVTYFLESLQTAFPESASQILPLLNSSEPPSAKIISDMVSNELQKIEDDFILVMDDFHRVSNSKISAFLSNVFEHPPRHMHLVISTRRDPSLPLQNYRASGFMNEIRIGDLKFNADETESFFKKSSIDIDGDNVNRKLFESIEGWPAGIRLAKLSLRNSDVATERIEKIPDEKNMITEYLFHEIVNKMEKNFYTLLLASSLVEKFSRDLIDSLELNENKISGEKFVDWLKEANIFIISLDNSNKWYRFHHLFRNLLLNEAQKSLSTEEIFKIHNSAGKWFGKNNLPEEGIYHYYKADNHVAAISTFECYRNEIMNKAQWRRLETILQLFPDNLIDSAAIELSRCWLLIYHGKALEMFNELDRVSNLVERFKDHEEHKNFMGELAVLFAYKIYNVDLDYELTIEYAEEAIQNLGKYNRYPMGMAWVFWGGAHQCQGRAASAIEAIYRELEKHKSGMIHFYLLLILNYIYWLEGDSTNLNTSAKQYLTRAEAEGEKEAEVNAKYFLGMYYYQINETGKAVDILEDAFKDRFYVIGIHQFGIISALVSSYMKVGKYDKAKSVIKLLSDYALEKGNPYFVLLRNSLEAEFNWLTGNYSEAERWASDPGEIPHYPFTNFMTPHLPLIKILAYSGNDANKEKAWGLIKIAEDLLRKTNNKFYLHRVLALKSIIHFERGDEDEAFSFLEESLKIAEAGNLLGYYPKMGNKLPPLLRAYSRLNKNTKFIGKILSLFKEEESDMEKDIPEKMTDRKDVADELLTKREFEILQQLSKKLRNKEIAEKLFISPDTVKRHTINIYHKFNVSSREQVVAKAKELGILS